MTTNNETRYFFYKGTGAGLVINTNMAKSFEKYNTDTDAVVKEHGFQFMFDQLEKIANGPESEISDNIYLWCLNINYLTVRGYLKNDDQNGTLSQFTN